MPFNQGFVRDLERGTVWLCDVDGLDVLTQSAADHFRNILGWLAVIKNAWSARLGRQTIALSTSRQALDTDNLLCLGVHDGDEGQWVGVKVGVWVSIPQVLSKAEALEVSFVLVFGFNGTIWPGTVSVCEGEKKSIFDLPWLNDQLKSLGNVKLGNSRLEFGTLLACIDKTLEFPW